MGYFQSNHIKKHIVGKRIRAIEHKENSIYGAVYIEFTDGSAIRFFPNTSAHTKECGCTETLLTNIVTPLGADGEVVQAE